MMGMLLNIKMERSLVGGRKGISLSTLLRDKVKEVRSVTAGGKQTWSRTYVQEALVGRSMEAPGAWARAHERPTGAALAAVPRLVRTGCSICQRGASLKITQTQSSATTWDRESKTLMDTHNCTVQPLLAVHV